jgi:hypothetical protein
MTSYFTTPNPLLVCVACLPAFFSSAAQLDARSTPPNAPRERTEQHSVIDYFYLLPSLGIQSIYGGDTPGQEKRDMLQAKNHPIIDVRHDFLQVQPDSSPTEQIAVFRSRRKPDLIADSSPDYQCEYNHFAFYRLQNGRLRDVTRHMLPVSIDPDRFLLKLPRFGTKIGVYRYDLPNSTETTPPRHVFDLQWRGGRFIKVR